MQKLDNAALIDSISAGVLGAAPQQAPAGQAPQQAPAGEKPTEKTAIEKAQSKLAPKGADQMSGDEAVQFIKVGDREMTQEQILGTMGRYKDLNYRWQSEVAPMKGVLDLAKNLLEAAKQSGAEAKPEDAVKFIQSAVDAYAKNPQFGSKQGKANAENNESPDGDDEYSSWEKENAVKLPPGLKETRQSVQSMQQQMAQLMQMMQQMAQGGAQQGQQDRQHAQQQLQQGQHLQSQAAVGMVRNNLTQTFSAMQLPIDEQTKADFRMFAMQRGYDFPDFIDPELTAIVVKDYKANKDAPEMERLRAIHTKRQAFTGAADQTPGGAGGSVAPAGDPMLSSMISSAMGRRGMA
jgi:hypothetical protein